MSLAEHALASGEITLMELTRLMAIVASSKDISYQGDSNDRVLRLCEAAEEKLAAMVRNTVGYG